MTLISTWELCFGTFSQNIFFFVFCILFLNKPLCIIGDLSCFCVWAGWEWEIGGFTVLMVYFKLNIGSHKKETLKSKSHHLLQNTSIIVQWVEQSTNGARTAVHLKYTALTKALCQTMCRCWG